jgi:hypothetical protein
VNSRLLRGRKHRKTAEEATTASTTILWELYSREGEGEKGRMGKREIGWGWNWLKSIPNDEYLFSPVGMDWLKSTAKLYNVLARLNNRVFHPFRKSLKSFFLTMNLQVPGKDQHNIMKTRGRWLLWLSGAVMGGGF